MKFLISTIIHAQLIYLCIIIFCYFVEKFTFIKFFFKFNNYKKTNWHAVGFAAFHSFFYFLINLFVFIYQYYKFDISNENISFIWLVISILLTIIVRNILFKCTNKDKTLEKDGLEKYFGD